MKTKAYRGLDKLTPKFRMKVEMFLKACPEIFITESWRSGERQKELVGSGLSKVKHSNHQDGKAVDIGFKGPILYPTEAAPWRKVANVAKKYGIEWGYDLWCWDKPHFQDDGLPIFPTPPPPMENKYADILEGYLKDGYTPIFQKHDGDQPLTEAETKCLIDIAVARLVARLNAK